MLPQLAGAELGVQEALDERGVGSFLPDAVYRFPPRVHPACHPLAQQVFHRRCQAQPLNTLRPPLRRDLVAGHAPDLFRIALKKREVQLSSKAVDQKVLQTVFPRNRPQPAAHIARADLQHAHHAQVADRVARQPDRVIEKAAQIVDPALARSYQHDKILVLWRRRQHHGLGAAVLRQLALPHRIRYRRLRRPRQRSHATQRRLLRQVRWNGHGLHRRPFRLLARLLARLLIRLRVRLLALVRRRPVSRHPTRYVWRHQFHPPLHNAVTFRKKAVTANVHAIALVAHRAGNAADLVRSLEHDGLDVRAAKQLERGRKARGTGSDGNACSHKAWDLLSQRGIARALRFAPRLTVLSTASAASGPVGSSSCL